MRTLCAQDTQDLFPGRQGSFGLESRGHSERSSATDGHFEREAVLPAGRERNTHEEKGSHYSQCRTVEVSSLRCHSSSREKGFPVFGLHVRWHQPSAQDATIFQWACPAVTERGSTRAIHPTLACLIKANSLSDTRHP